VSPVELGGQGLGDSSATTTLTTTYSIKVTGGKGVAAWAVFSGKTNIKHKLAATAR